jgi:uncharacterized iron-regulated membrane protein
MPLVRHHDAGKGPHDDRHGAGRVYRGSRKRIRRIKWRDNTSIEFWILVLLMLLLLFVGIPWMIRHPPADHDDHGSAVHPGASSQRELLCAWRLAHDIEIIGASDTPEHRQRSAAFPGAQIAGDNARMG